MDKIKLFKPYKLQAILPCWNVKIVMFLNRVSPWLCIVRKLWPKLIHKLTQGSSPL
jgi:hypothetical protein